MLVKALSLKAILAASAVVLGAGTAAAATGSLPGAAQTTASDVLHHVGISVPGANAHHHGHADTRDSADHDKGKEGHKSKTSAVSPSQDEGNGPNTHALFGLCTARNANDGHPDAANADVFPSTAQCASVTHPGKSDTSDDATESPVAPSSGGTACVDHADQGNGNQGDPGNGNNHHNEDNGTGNHGDPGNGKGQFCPNE